jgi:type I restriction enzyme S subunit
LHGDAAEYRRPASADFCGGRMSVNVPVGYKQTEVGVIPQDWDAVALDVVCGMKSGQGITAAQIGDLSKYPCYGGNGLRGYTTCFTHDGAFALIGRQGALCGNVVGVSGKFFASEHAVVVTARHGANIGFLTYVLGEMHLNRYSESSAQPGLSVSKVLMLRAAVPPTETEQHAIAQALSDVDALLGGLDRLIAKKRDLKQATMQQLLTGRTRLPGFSGEWEKELLGEICDISIGRTPPRLNSAMWGGNHVWLSIADLKGKAVSVSKEQITDLATTLMTIIPKGTLLMSFKLSIGRLCFAGCDLFTNEAICSFNNLTEDANFLYYALVITDFSLYGKQAVKGYTLNKESLSLVELYLPPRPEQTAIAAIFSDMDAELAVLEARRDKTQRLKQAMMQELLTGRIRLV